MMVDCGRPRAWLLLSMAIPVSLWMATGLCRASEVIPAAGAEPSPIRFNSLGFLPDAVKQATVLAKEGAEFAIRDVSTGRRVLTGRLSTLQSTTANDEQVFVADFSVLDREGHYQLEVDGTEAPRRFRVATDLYNWPFYVCTRGMYLWRCGTEVEGEFAGDVFRHPACHLDDAYLDYVGGPPGQRKDGTGGWHDAGDYNKYTVNAAFTVGMMLQAWEHFGEVLAALKMDIPESGNNVPDFLDEVRWELEWLLKMQSDDGRVYHKISTLKFGGFILPHQEAEPRYFSPWSSAATASFAAVMAQAARVFREIDQEFAQRCLDAAEKSYRFMQAHPEDQRPDLSAFKTGGYNAPDADNRLWAAAELWETTGEREYLIDVEQRIESFVGESGQDTAVVDENWDWDNVRNLGLFTYLLSERPGRDAALVARVRRDAVQAAEAIVETASRHPYRRPLGARHYWGCNGTVARQTMNLHVARRLTGEPRYREAMLDALNYLFGRNPFGRSFVTGIGHMPPKFPHDRRSGGDDVDAPWPGYLVGGPWPGPNDWFDVQKDYRTNEIAINWNGALIYALAAFVEPATFDDSITTARRALCKAQEERRGSCQAAEPASPRSVQQQLDLADAGPASTAAESSEGN